MIKPIDQHIIENVLRVNMERQLEAIAEAQTRLQTAKRSNDVFWQDHLRHELSKIVTACTAAMGLSATLVALRKASPSTTGRQENLDEDVMSMADQFRARIAAKAGDA